MSSSEEHSTHSAVNNGKPEMIDTIQTGGNGSVSSTLKNRPPPSRNGGNPPQHNPPPHQHHPQQQQQHDKHDDSHARLHGHKRSNSADLTQAYQQQQVQQQQRMRMMMHAQYGNNSASLGAAAARRGAAVANYANMYGGGTNAAPPPPQPPSPHGLYYAYGAPAAAYMSQSMHLPETMPYAQQQQQQQQPMPMLSPESRSRSWSSDPSMFDRQQQAPWMHGMQAQPPPQQQQSLQPPTPFHSEMGYNGAPFAQQPQTTTHSKTNRHRRSTSSSSSSMTGGQPAGHFSPRAEFMKLANVTPSSPRASSPRGQQPQYSSGSPYSPGDTPTTAPASAYSPHLQVPTGMPGPPPLQAYEIMYDFFQKPGTTGNAVSPFMSRDPRDQTRTYQQRQHHHHQHPPPTTIHPTNTAMLSTGSLGSTGGEAVYLAQRARGIPSSGSKAESSARKRHMRQQSVQLFMQDVKGTEQPPACRDVVFLLLFAFHLFGMVLLSNMYSYEALEPTTDSEDLLPSADATTVTVDYHNLLIIAGCCGAFSMFVSTTLLGVMVYFARNFVKVALIVAIALSFVWGTLGIGLSPQNLVPLTGIVALALAVAYAIVVWDRVPFSTANLLTALSAIRAYPGTVVMTLGSQFLGLVWSVYYAVICCGIYDAMQKGRISVSERWQTVIYVMLGVSYYWTIQVVLNAVQVASAAVVGRWWYLADDDNTVRKTTFRTIFYSMGSICFGSLFVGPVKVIRQLAVLFRPSSDEASLLILHECLHCIRTCITGCVNNMTESFNPWGFAYVGLYGYAFPEASSLASELFAKRGWTTIVSDDLVPNVLLMTSVVVGGVTGCFGFLLSGLEKLHVASLETPGVVSFFLGMVVGLVLTSILFGAINGSVNAVIILFATSPVDFERNYQKLSHEMRAAWREVWPGAVDDVDIRLAMAMAGAANGNNRGANAMAQSPLLGPISSGVVPPPPPIIPQYAQLANERTPLMNER